MPPCVLETGHEGDHTDGFGGFYGPGSSEGEPGGYYVSVFDKDGNDRRGRVGLLAGPFLTHAEALGLVDRTRNEAEKVDPRACWYAFGTCRLKEGARKPGRLNDLLGLPV